MLHDTTSTSSRRDRAGTRAMNFVRYRSPQGFTVRTPPAATSFVCPPAHIRPTCASQISHSQDSSAVADMLHLLHPHIPTCMKPHWALRRELHLLGR